MIRRAQATAHANIALAKYWGKSDAVLNLPAVPSVSMTLEGLRTETTVELDPSLDADTFELDGRPSLREEAVRVASLLDEVRAEAGERSFARVSSRNFFPTASGLASSASGFAALASAARAAFGLATSREASSRLARRASASAARSVYGGFVGLAAGVPGDDALVAQPLWPAEHWDVRMLVAVVSEARKPIGSRDAMERSRHTSPYYAAWLETAPILERAIRDAIAARDLARLGEATEASFSAMHACAFANHPFTLYLDGASIEALKAVRALRDDGVPAYATMDAGPHVKVLCAAASAASVRARLAGVPGVLRVLEARPGPGVAVRIES